MVSISLYLSRFQYGYWSCKKTSHKTNNDPQNVRWRISNWSLADEELSEFSGSEYAGSEYEAEPEEADKVSKEGETENSSSEKELGEEDPASKAISLIKGRWA